MRLTSYIVAILGTVAVAMVFLPFHDLISDKPGTVAFAEIVVIVLVAVRWGTAPALAASMTAVLLWDFLYLPPYFAFKLTDRSPANVALLIAVVVVSIVVGNVSGRAKRRADEAERREKEIEDQAAVLQRESMGRRRAEERFQTLLEFSMDAVLVADSEGNIRLANPQAEKLFGYTRRELEGLPVETLMPERFRARHVHQRESYFENPVVRTMGHKGMQLYGIHKDGTEFPVQIGLSPLVIEDGVLATATVRDMTETKRTEDALREREARIRRLIDANIIGIISWTTDGTITEANDAFLRMIGRTREELRAGSIQNVDITPLECRPGDINALRELKKTGICTPFRKEYVRKDNSRVPVLVGGTFLEGSHEKGIGFVLDLSEQRQMEESLRYAAQHDALTGLANRTLIEDRLTQAIANARRERRHVALLLIDLDYFKHINDSLGHQVGDRLLRTVARRLQNCLREGDSVARLGGDEFVICLPALPDAAEAALVAQKLLEALREPTRLEKQELHVSGSIGISLFPTDGDDTSSLMRAADTAMYHAKERGRDNYQFFTAALNEAAQKRQIIANRLHHALERNEIVLHYQPKVDLESGKILAIEALARWYSPDIGTVPPAEFIPVAEETGVIVSLGEWVLRRACEQLSEWRRRGYSNIQIAVNLSPRQLHAPGFVELAERILHDTGLPPSALELEITETALMAQSPENTDTLGRLAGIGIGLAIDDFGTGHSNLSYLQRFPIRTIKIDKSFITGVGRDANNTAIVTAVIAMAHTLHLAVVAEGVETPDQATFLKAHGCTAGQGFYFSEPVDADGFWRLLESSLEKYSDRSI